MRSEARTFGLPLRSRARAALAPLLVALALASATGCAQTDWVRLREVPENPLAGPLKLLSPTGPQPTGRTMLLVRRYNLENDFKHNSAQLLARLYEINKHEPSADKLYSLAELSYLAGKRAEPINRRHALELHGLADGQRVSLSCSTNVLVVSATPTTPSFAARAIFTTARWKARYGSSRKTRQHRARRHAFDYEDGQPDASKPRSCSAETVGARRTSRAFASSPTMKSAACKTITTNYGLGVPLIADS